jgi:hypothetical protein
MLNGSPSSQPPDQRRPAGRRDCRSPRGPSPALGCQEESRSVPTDVGYAPWPQYEAAARPTLYDTVSVLGTSTGAEKLVAGRGCRRSRPLQFISVIAASAAAPGGMVPANTPSSISTMPSTTCSACGPSRVRAHLAAKRFCELRLRLLADRARLGADLVTQAEIAGMARFRRNAA